MVQRAEQKDTIYRVITLIQFSRVPQLYTGDGAFLAARALFCLLNVFWDRVDENYFIAQSGEPAGIDSRTAPNIKHHRRYRREMAEDQFLGAGEFQPKPPCLEPRVFVGLLIMSNDILKMSLFADCHIFHASGDQE